MTVDEFLEQIKSYYGEYKRPGIEPHIREFLEPYQKTYDLADILKLVFLNISSQFGFVPDIAAIQSCITKENAVRSDDKKAKLLGRSPWAKDEFCPICGNALEGGACFHCWLKEREKGDGESALRES